MVDDNFSKFGKSFQESLAYLILIDRPFADQIFEVLEYTYFEIKYLQVFIKLISDYREKYKIHPTPKILETLIRTKLDNFPEIIQKQIINYFNRLQTDGIDGREFIKDTALDFCKKQKLKQALVESVKLIEKSSFDEVAGVINKALILGTHGEIGHEYIKDFEIRYSPKEHRPIPTGWDEINSIMKGGLGRGQLGVVVAPSGAGKSMVLVHLGVKALMEGKTVIHYTLELDESTIGIRYDCCAAGVDLSEAFDYKEAIEDTIIKIPGELIIKEYPTKFASTQTIQAHLEKLKMRGIKPDMIIVDYGDLLRPAKNTTEKRHQLEEIYEELRGLAKINDSALWTASQTNRGGQEAEVITMESISEAYNKVFPSDFIFSVSRTKEDKLTNTARFFVAKNRNGPDGIVYPVYFNPSKVKIDILDGSKPAVNNNSSKTNLTKALKNVMSDINKSK